MITSFIITPFVVRKIYDANISRLTTCQRVNVVVQLPKRTSHDKAYTECTATAGDTVGSKSEGDVNELSSPSHFGPIAARLLTTVSDTSGEMTSLTTTTQTWRVYFVADHTSSINYNCYPYNSNIIVMTTMMTAIITHNCNNIFGR